MTQQQPGLIRQVLDDVHTVLTDPLGKTSKSVTRPIRAATLLVLAIVAALVVWGIVAVLT
jgi:hypothetical protein